MQADENDRNGSNVTDALADFSRFPCMGSTEPSTRKRRGDKGSFAGKGDELLSLFPEPDALVESGWRQTFGYERRPEKPARGRPFIARGEPRSSSGS
jgi:hypothetical protein